MTIVLFIRQSHTFHRASAKWPNELVCEILHEIDTNLYVIHVIRESEMEKNWLAYNTEWIEWIECTHILEEEAFLNEQCMQALYET